MSQKDLSPLLLQVILAIQDVPIKNYVYLIYFNISLMKTIR